MIKEGSKHFAEYRMKLKTPILLTIVFILFTTPILGPISMAQSVALMACTLFLLTIIGMILSWRVRVSECSISVGYKLPRSRFIVKRQLLYKQVGRVWENGAGDVVLFHESSYTYPGRTEIALSHDLKGFHTLVQTILMNVDNSRVDENVKKRFNIA